MGNAVLGGRCCNGASRDPGGSRAGTGHGVPRTAASYHVEAVVPLAVGSDLVVERSIEALSEAPTKAERWESRKEDEQLMPTQRHLVAKLGK